MVPQTWILLTPPSQKGGGAYCPEHRVSWLNFERQKLHSLLCSWLCFLQPQPVARCELAGEYLGVWSHGSARCHGSSSQDRKLVSVSAGGVRRTLCVLMIFKTCCFSCPSAGLIVKHMGLPLKLVAMVNSNDIVHRTVTSGDFSMAANVTQTLAPAIDIQVQVLHLLVGGCSGFFDIIRGVACG